MKSQRTSISSALLLALGLTLSASASAQSTWNVYSGSSGGSGCTQNGTYSGTYNNSWACTSVTGGTAGTAMTASAWSTDRTNSSTPSHSLTGSGFASAYMSSQGNSGFGAASRTEGLSPSSPDHAFDSYNPGTMDALLLDFGSTSVILDKIGLGWTQSDADITVMRWTGTTAPTRTNGTSSLSGDGQQNLTNVLYNPATPLIAGWQLVGSYADLGTDSSVPFGGAARDINTTQSSSWWLISTFNTTLTGGSTSCTAANGSTTTCGAGNDSFKFNYVTTKTGGGGGQGVPEPGSLALAMLALVGGAWGTRRRTQKSR